MDLSSKSADLSIVRLDGTDPRCWGRQHGEALRDQISVLAEIRSKLLRDSLVGWSDTAIARLCDEQLASLAERWPRVLAELEGISEASGLGLRELIVLNGYTDLRDFSASEDVPVETGCSALAVRGRQANFAAQTWDMHASAEPFTVLLEFPDAPRPMRVLSVVGCMGLAGVNAAGVSVMINTLQSRETDRRGLLWPGLVRLMLEQPTAQAAVNFLGANRPNGGRNFIIADRNEAFDVETTGRRTELLGSITVDRPGHLIHSNHYLGSLKTTEIGERLGATTHARLTALEKFFISRPTGELTGEEVRRNFLESGMLCDCVNLCASGPHAAATCGGLAIDHLGGKGYAFRGRFNMESALEWNLDAGHL